MKEIVEEFFRKLPIEVSEVEVIETRIHPIFSVRSPDSGVLIGVKGENLRALNHVLRKIADKQCGEDSEQFILDVNGYHRRRMEEIEQQASMLAERARMFQHNVEMSPMNAYERMVVHSFLSEVSDIETESQGEKQYRHVVIKHVPESDGSVANSTAEYKTFS